MNATSHIGQKEKVMDRSAVVVAVGLPSMFEQDKATLELKGKPLIKHVVDNVEPLVDEVVVVAGSQESVAVYEEILGPHVKFVAASEADSVLLAALAGFQAASQKHVLLVPCDAPFVSVDVAELFFELCQGKAAVVARWPNSEIEPLHAVYNRKVALEAAEMAVEDECVGLEAMVENMCGIRYVSTLVVQEMDPELRTFFSVNSLVDLKRAEVMATPRRKRRTV